MTLTREQQTILRYADMHGHFSEADSAACPGLHFCRDWDDLPVCDDSPEKSGCTCLAPRKVGVGCGVENEPKN